MFFSRTLLTNYYVLVRSTRSPFVIECISLFIYFIAIIFMSYPYNLRNNERLEISSRRESKIILF